MCRLEWHAESKNEARPREHKRVDVTAAAARARTTIGVFLFFVFFKIDPPFFPFSPLFTPLVALFHLLSNRHCRKKSYFSHLCEVGGL